MAVEAVKSGKVVIQNATDFFAWTQSVICTMNKVLFIFVQSEVCKESAKNLLDVVSETNQWNNEN